MRLRICVAGLSDSFIKSIYKIEIPDLKMIYFYQVSSKVRAFYIMFGSERTERLYWNKT